MNKRLGVFSMVFLCRYAFGLTLSGPISANSVNVVGDVAFSSMTVSTLTVINQINTSSGITGRVLQVRISSSTTSTTISTTTFTPVTAIARSITLSNASNYVRISLSGSFFINANPFSSPGYITIFRDSTNLGDSSLGLLADISPSSIDISTAVGIVMLDFPGDTNAHTYQVYIRLGALGAGFSASFPSESVGYLVLEEMGHQ